MRKAYDFLKENRRLYFLNYSKENYLQSFTVVAIYIQKVSLTQPHKEYIMCVYRSDLPLLVAYPSPEDKVLYGILVSNGETCEVIDVLTRDKLTLPRRDVMEFTWARDYIQLDSGIEPHPILKGIIVRTNEGKVGVLQSIRLITPHQAHNAFVKYMGEYFTTELWLADIADFIGHTNVELNYK